MAEVSVGGLPARVWTYAELRDDVVRLALALLSRFQPGERIAISAPNSPEWVQLQLAAAFAGLALTALDPAIPRRDLAQALKQCRAVALFVAGAAGDSARCRIAAQVTSETPRLREIVDLQDRRALYGKQRCVDGLPEVLPDDLAFGWMAAAPGCAPKAVLITHRAMTDHAYATVLDRAASVGGPLLHGAPMFASGMSGSFALGAIAAGCRLILPSSATPDRLLEIAAEEGAEIILTTSDATSGLIRAQTAQPRDLVALRTVVTLDSGAADGPAMRVITAAPLLDGNASCMNSEFLVAPRHATALDVAA